jgi:hypothetical protein
MCNLHDEGCDWVPVMRAFCREMIFGKKIEEKEKEKLQKQQD